MDNWNTALALTYHEETKHSYDSLLRDRHFLDWANQPRPFKEYLGLEAIPLPTALPVTAVPALFALASEPTRTPRPLSLADLAYLLFYTAGVTRRRVYPGYGEMCFRAAACTGALYHIDLYVSVRDMPGLPAGVYHFDPQGFALRQLRQGDYRQVLVEASGHDPALHDAPVVLLGSDTFWRNAWKYRSRTYRHSFWDAGTILANLLAAATALRVPAHLTLGFADEPVNALLDLDITQEAVLFLGGLGTGQAPPTRVLPMPPLALAVAPLSAASHDYPAITILHTASSLETPADATDWRTAVPLPPAAPAPGTLFPLAPDTRATLPVATLEEVIRHRGSARHFTEQPLALAALSNILTAAVQPIPTDYQTDAGQHLNDLYLIVHAVTGLPSGAYVFHAQEQMLECLAAGDFRQQAGELALGQDQAAEASAVVFCLCDLPSILEAFGNRGYRAAQLEAGLMGGRMYLAAYAQGCSATGLTFFDDDVTDFFAPHATEKSVMFLIALGYVARRT